MRQQLSIHCFIVVYLNNVHLSVQQCHENSETPVLRSWHKPRRYKRGECESGLTLGSRHYFFEHGIYWWYIGLERTRATPAVSSNQYRYTQGSGRGRGVSNNSKHVPPRNILPQSTVISFYHCILPLLVSPFNTARIIFHYFLLLLIPNSITISGLNFI